MTNQRPPNLTCIEDKLWIVDQHLGVGIYDFDFRRYFHCHHPHQLDAPVIAVARLGATSDYTARYAQLLTWDIQLIHTPEMYARTSLLPHWYPLISAWTPRSHIFERVPTRAEVEALFEYPLFMKGERQTSKHQRAMAIIEDAAQLDDVLSIWFRDEILHWQRVVCRQYIPLRAVAPDHGGGLPMCFEFRTFWWRNQCVGIGRYWTAVQYEPSPTERDAILALGGKVARAMDVTFLVIDIAQSIEGQWIVIECNDGQDSGYVGVDRRQMWQSIIDLIP